MFKSTLRSATAILWVLALASGIFVSAASTGDAQTAAPWTAAGSTGVPDEEDALAVEFG